MLPSDPHDLDETILDDSLADEPLAGEAHAQLRFEVGEDEAGKRLDAVLAAASDTLSRTRIKALIEEGRVSLDTTAARDASQKVKAGQVILLDLPEAVEAEPKGEDIPLDIVFEDEHIIVVDKPAGLVVHPAPGHPSGTLVNALIFHCGASLSGIGGVKRPGIVHRIDKDTSGLLVVAKTDAAHQGLSALFADHGRTMPFTRRYRALVWGRPERAFGTVDAPIGRHATDRQRMAVVSAERGREAITHWRLEDSFGPDPKNPVVSLFACELETGRTHQIRVHMAHLRHPVLGDPLYAKGFRGKSNRLDPEAQMLVDALGRQALHAAVLSFEHPITGEPLDFESPLPQDFERLLAALGQAGA